MDMIVDTLGAVGVEKVATASKNMIEGEDLSGFAVLMAELLAQNAGTIVQPSLVLPQEYTETTGDSKEEKDFVGSSFNPEQMPLALSANEPDKQIMTGPSSTSAFLPTGERKLDTKALHTIEAVPMAAFPGEAIASTAIPLQVPSEKVKMELFQRMRQPEDSLSTQNSVDDVPDNLKNVLTPVVLIQEQPSAAAAAKSAYAEAATGGKESAGRRTEDTGEFTADPTSERMIEFVAAPITDGENTAEGIVERTIEFAAEHTTDTIEQRTELPIEMMAPPLEMPTAKTAELKQTTWKVPVKDIAQELPRLLFTSQKGRFTPEGSKEFTIQLEPAELGRMTVKLSSHEGMVSVKIYTENTETRNIIENSLQSLRQSFEEQGIKCGQMDVELAGQSFSQSGSGQHFFAQERPALPRFWADKLYYADVGLETVDYTGQKDGQGIDYMV
jgi:hypothetical protein